MAYKSVSETAQRWNMNERRVRALCRDGRVEGSIRENGIWRIPESAEAPLDARTREFALKKDMKEQKNEAENAVKRFEDTYFKAPEHLVFTPYRVCPIGAHIDHQWGKITGLAIDKGIHLAYHAKQNGVIELSSVNFPKRAQWHISSVPETRQGDWADHLRGATLALAAKHRLQVGICGVLEGDLPIGGLSSSAAVIITFLTALCRANGITLSDQELIMTAKRAENEYVGVSCGKLDQSCEVLSKKDHLLYLDTLNNSYELIPTAPSMKPYEIAVFFSGLERSLAGSGYNMRVDECKSAAYALKAFSGMEYGKYEDTRLRDVPEEVFEHYAHRLPEKWRMRAEHYYGEMRRVEAGAEAWRRGDIEAYGRLCFESGKSSIELYDTGSPELKALYEIMTRTDGIWGGRFSGAGFKGCCMALIDPAYRESILEKVEKEYTALFPALKGKYTAAICLSANGVHL